MKYYSQMFPSAMVGDVYQSVHCPTLFLFVTPGPQHIGLKSPIQHTWSLPTPMWASNPAHLKFLGNSPELREKCTNLMRLDEVLHNRHQVPAELRAFLPEVQEMIRNHYGHRVYHYGHYFAKGL